MLSTKVFNQHYDREGQVSYNKYGAEMMISEYRGVTDITVKFENGYITKSNYSSFIHKSIISPFDKTVYNIGYLGMGKYTVSDENGRRTKQYMHWQEMIRRCYDKELHKRAPTYIGCTVCEEWFNFQVFCKWYDKNIYEVGNEQMNLDKDILVKGNKVYSPSTCIFIPKRINLLFIRGQSTRGLYPIGVSKDSRYEHKMFRAECNSGYTGNIRNRYHLGSFDTPEEAFDVYKEFKEDLIKKIANHYKEYIPEKLYDAMYNYQVLITD